MPYCAEALAGVQRIDRYPVDWPDDPLGWLTPSGMLGAWVVADGPTVLGHVALTGADRALAGAVGVPATQLAAVARLFVSPPARGHGLAARLLATAAEAAVAAGLRPVLEVESGASAAIALYERAGWRFVSAMTGDWTTAAGQPAVLRVYTGPVAR